MRETQHRPCLANAKILPPAAYLTHMTFTRRSPTPRSLARLEARLRRRKEALLQREQLFLRHAVRVWLCALAVLSVSAERAVYGWAQPRAQPSAYDDEESPTRSMSS